MYKVIVTPNAEADLNDIITYLAGNLNSPNAAKQMYFKIREKIESLSSMPYRCALVLETPYAQKGIRKLFVENYIIFFVVNEEEQVVYVMRILYNRREWHNLI